MLLENILPGMRNRRWAALPDRPEITIRDNHLVTRDGKRLRDSEDIVSGQWSFVPPTKEQERLTKLKNEVDALIAKQFKPEWLTPELCRLSKWLTIEIQELE